MKSLFCAVASVLLATAAPVAAEPFSINDALKQATLTILVSVRHLQTGVQQSPSSAKRKARYYPRYV